jgi:hypothetical protein
MNFSDNRLSLHGSHRINIKNYRQHYETSLQHKCIQEIFLAGFDQKDIHDRI